MGPGSVSTGAKMSEERMPSDTLRVHLCRVEHPFTFESWFWYIRRCKHGSLRFVQEIHPCASVGNAEYNTMSDEQVEKQATPYLDVVRSKLSSGDRSLMV
jgi:hypothetical protein